MTNQGAFTLMLEQTKTPYTVEDNSFLEFPEGTQQIEVGNTKHPDDRKIIGYSGFISFWIFDKDGKFLGVGHYE